MQLKVFGKGFNFSQDGPGNRLVYHLKGCNMHCPWCSNPEGMLCDVGDFYILTKDELLSEVLLSKPMFFEGGGVTFTGGEATIQFDSLFEIIKALKENDISVAIETNGTSKKLSQLFPLLNHLIIDLKHPDSNKHKETTGISNEIIKQNILLAAKSGVDLLIRIPLIGGFNTHPEELNRFIEFLKSIKGKNVKVEVLKYHEYGKDKWEKCGLEYKMKDAFVPEETRISFEEKIKSVGLTVIRT